MGRRLYVGNLSYNTTDDSLREAFSQVGTVDTATVISDRETGRARGFGFVEMSTDEEAKKAVDTLNNTQLDGRTITVNEARPREAREGGGRPGGRREGGGYGGRR